MVNILYMKDNKPRLTFYCVGCGDQTNKIRVKGEIEEKCPKCASSYKTLSLDLKDGFSTVELLKYRGKRGFDPKIEEYPNPFCPLCGRPSGLKLVEPESYKFECPRCKKKYIFLYKEEAFD
jgi:Zn finger protein HypA/HybF involved in hydrogenase expression